MSERHTECEDVAEVAGNPEPTEPFLPVQDSFGSLSLQACVRAGRHVRCGKGWCRQRRAELLVAAWPSSM